MSVLECPFKVEELLSGRQGSRVLSLVKQELGSIVQVQDLRNVLKQQKVEIRCLEIGIRGAQLRYLLTTKHMMILVRAILYLCVLWSLTMLEMEGVQLFSISISIFYFYFLFFY